MDVYGVIGQPVGHSLSPVMHEAGFTAAGIDARYVTFEPPADAAAPAVDAAAILGIAGLNVTIPFKEGVLDAVAPDPLARRIGAVNTIAFTGDPPTGYNTDAEGAVRALRHHDVDLEGAIALLLGAGGAGRAIAHGLADAGASVHIANRTVERAEAVAEGVPDAAALPLASAADVAPEVDLLVNATSVGMDGEATILAKDALRPHHVVMDAVYRPLRTPFLREADAVGARTVDGAWMLLYQGVGAFERWTGVTAPVDAMNRALRDALGTL